MASGDIIITNIKVITGPIWLFTMFNGFKNPKETAMLKPIIDPDGNPVISPKVLQDPTWKFIDGSAIEDPINSSDIRPITGWLSEINYKYIEEEI